MTLTSNSGNSEKKSKVAHQNTIQLLHHIINYLTEFENHYGKKFNVSKLAGLLGLSNGEIDEIVSLLLNFQEIFTGVFKNYKLKKIRAGNQLYLICIKKEWMASKEIEIPEIVRFSTSQLKLFNDIIYVFKFVKRGKGFDVSKNGSDLLTNIRRLRTEHPCLFTSHDYGIIYPSEFGLKLGELIISYNKSNKEIKELTVDNCIIEVLKDG
ncbi:MAG: hypothetical protein ACFFBV_04410 [Promethearchaeota archaeon]